MVDPGPRAAMMDQGTSWAMAGPGSPWAMEGSSLGGGLCHESGCHSLQLHITHGLHLPSFTAHTLSRPPLHQSHSCHHSLINSDCLTTPAPHSLTHIKAAHKHSPSAKNVFPWLTFWAFPLFSDSLCLPGLPIYSDRLLPALLTLPACWYLLCLLPAPTLHCPCCWFCLAFITPVTTFDHCLSDHLLSINKAAIGSNYTASSLQRKHSSHWVSVCVLLLCEWMRCRCGEAIRVDEWMVTAVWLV